MGNTVSGCAAASKAVVVGAPSKMMSVMCCRKGTSGRGMGSHRYGSRAGKYDDSDDEDSKSMLYNNNLLLDDDDDEEEQIVILTRDKDEKPAPRSTEQVTIKASVDHSVFTEG